MKVEIVKFPDLTENRELKFLILLISQLLRQLNTVKGESPHFVLNITGEVSVSC